MLIEKTETKPQRMLEVKMNKERDTISFNHPITLFEEGKWLLAVTSFEATTSVFKIPISGHWKFNSAQKTIGELNKLLELRSQNHIELQVEQVRKKGIISLNGYSLSSLGTFKNEILEESKVSK